MKKNGPDPAVLDKGLQRYEFITKHLNSIQDFYLEHQSSPGYIHVLVSRNYTDLHMTYSKANEATLSRFKSFWGDQKPKPEETVMYFEVLWTEDYTTHQFKMTINTMEKNES